MGTNWCNVKLACRENCRCDLNDESRRNDVGGRDAINFSTLQLLEKAAHKREFRCIAHRDHNSIRYSTVITTFPLAWPSSRYRIASGTSLNDLYVRSMTVFNFPDCTISARSVRSCVLGCAIIMPIFCLTNREYTAAFSALPSPPRKPCSFALPPPIIT